MKYPPLSVISRGFLDEQWFEDLADLKAGVYTTDRHFDRFGIPRQAKAEILGLVPELFRMDCEVRMRWDAHPEEEYPDPDCSDLQEKIRSIGSKLESIYGLAGMLAAAKCVEDLQHFSQIYKSVRYIEFCWSGIGKWQA